MKLLLLVVSWLIFADPSPARTYTQKNSDCIVKSTAGEYPMFKVYIKNKVVFSPKSDGILPGPKFSKDGKKVTLRGSEISLIDIEPNKYIYKKVMIDCKSGKIKGKK